MTEGSLFGKIIVFTLPLMLTNLLQVFYNAADMMVVSLSPETDAVGAIGITGAYIGLVINIFMGFAVGTNVVVARHLGARDDDNVKRAVHTSMLLGLILGFIGSGAGFLSSRAILSLMGAEGKLLELAVKYTYIYFAGTPFVAVTNYAVAIIRAKGDTKTPLYVLGATGILNVILNVFFVLACGMSVEGVALATLIANAVSTVILVAILAKDDGACRFCPKKLRLDRRALRDIVRIGLPAGLQSALFSISNMLITSSILRVNNILAPADAEFQPVVKANAAVGNLESFVYTATNSVAQAAVTFTSQNVGADKPQRVKNILVDCYIISAAVALFFSGMLLILNHPLLALYGVVDGAEGTLSHIAYQTAMSRLWLCTAPYVLLAFMETGSGVLRGLGRSTTAMIVTLLGCCGLRIVWIFTVFEVFLNMEVIYISYPISWTISGIVHLIAVIFALKEIIADRNKRPSCQPS